MAKSENRFALLELEGSDSEGTQGDFEENSDWECHGIDSQITRKFSSRISNYKAVTNVVPVSGNLSKGTIVRNDNQFELQPRTRIPGLVLDRSEIVFNERIKNDFLCQACQSIFQDCRKLDEYGNSEEFDLHNTYDSFTIAIIGECYICNQILHSIKENVDGHDHEAKLELSFQCLRCEVVQEELDQYLFFTYHRKDGSCSNILELKLQSIPGE